MVDTPANFEITDFRLAGFLLAHGCRFVGVGENTRGEVVFKFDSQRPGDEGLSPSQWLPCYPGSLEYKYDAACRTMHDFVKLASNSKVRRR